MKTKLLRIRVVVQNFCSAFDGQYTPQTLVLTVAIMFTLFLTLIII